MVRIHHLQKRAGFEINLDETPTAHVNLHVGVTFYEEKILKIIHFILQLLYVCTLFTWRTHFLFFFKFPFHFNVVVIIILFPFSKNSLHYKVRENSKVQQSKVC